MASYPEVLDVVNQIGRTDDGTDTDGYYNSEFFVPLRNEKDWPAVVEQQGWRRWLYGLKRPRTKEELIKEMDAELERKLPGVSWNFSQNIRDNVMESLSGIKGDNSLKIVGPDFKELQRAGHRGAETSCRPSPGLEDVAVFNVLGQSHLEFRPTRKNASDGACRWPTSITSRLSPWAAKAVTGMIEGEKSFRCVDPLAGMAAGQRNFDSRHSRRCWQQPGGPAPGAGIHAFGDWDQPGPAGRWRQPGQHGQPAQ